MTNEAGLVFEGVTENADYPDWRLFFSRHLDGRWSSFATKKLDENTSVTARTPDDNLDGYPDFQACFDAIMLEIEAHERNKGLKNDF